MRLFRVIIGILLVHIIYSFSGEFGFTAALISGGVKQTACSLVLERKSVFRRKTILRLDTDIYLSVLSAALFRKSAIIAGVFIGAIKAAIARDIY